MATDTMRKVRPEPYADFQRQDRQFIANSYKVPMREPAGTQHWASMHASTFTKMTPSPHKTATFRPELEPVLPSPKKEEPLKNTAASHKDLIGEVHKQVVLGSPKPAPMSVPKGANSPEGKAPNLADTGSSFSGTSTWPMQRAREQLTGFPSEKIKELRYSTTQSTKHPPGYMGHIPSPEMGARARQHGWAQQPRATQRCKEDTLFDSFREKPVGYLGYTPTSVYNRRTWSQKDLAATTQGAGNQSMTGMNAPLKRPEAGGTSGLLHEMFAGPLEGRPSDNGEFNSQIFYKLLRPLEGACRAFHPSSIHPAGRKFLKPSVVMKNF